MPTEHDFETARLAASMCRSKLRACKTEMEVNRWATRLSFWLIEASRMRGILDDVLALAES